MSDEIKRPKRLEENQRILSSQAELKSLYGEPQERSVLKVNDFLDETSRRFIEAAPFAVLATADAAGNLDCSPRGDKPGFVRVADEKTLLLPDRRGNNRTDSLKNIIENPNIALLFFVPNVAETFRVNGTAQISVAPDLLEQFAVEGKTPKTVLIIRVREAFVHCSRALVRSDYKTIETEVVIVGAGPTGLALACQLIRYGVDFVIFDRKKGITDLSKAITVQARTLEIYEQIGLDERAVEAGAIARGANIVANGEIRASLDLSDIGKNLSPFPFALLLEQSKNERLLDDYLQQHGKTVEWQTTLENLIQPESSVTATINNASGETQEIRAKYLVACDSAKSLVRHRLDFEFEGTTIEALFYVADVEMEFPSGKHDEIYVSFGADSFVALFPLKETNFWRIVGNVPEAENERRTETEVDYEETEARVRELLKMPIDIRGVKWFSTYRVHSRRVDKFRDRRVFLAGDAAHIHTPAGGQGMNTGIGDAYNLAWKLAFVLWGKADESLLDTYNTERLENAKHLLETTDRAFTFGTHDDFLTAFVRTHIFPFVAQYALRFDLVKQTLFPLVSQIGINYRHSPLSRHEGDKNFKIKAGDRIPYFTVDGKSVFAFLREPKFHFLVFSNDEINFDALLGEDRKDGRWINYQSFLLAPRVSEIFGSDKAFCILLRPDNHIAFISERISSDELKSYHRIVGDAF